LRICITRFWTSQNDEKYTRRFFDFWIWDFLPAVRQGFDIWILTFEFMKKLLIATSNPAKLAEIRLFLSDLPLMCVGLDDVGIADRAVESGKTFEENAVIKATFYAKLSGLPTVADDGGFEIDALGGAPGVKSHRWIHGDRDDDDEELINYTMEQMKGLPQAKRGAQLRLVLAYVDPKGLMHTSEAKIRGIVPEKPSSRRTPGFPYRSLLFLPEINKFYDHGVLTSEETDRLNHRKKAVEKLRPQLSKLLTEGK
jgi:XTP/dITP diphosphohydrolase